MHATSLTVDNCYQNLNNPVSLYFFLSWDVTEVGGVSVKGLNEGLTFSYHVYKREKKTYKGSFLYQPQSHLYYEKSHCGRIT